MIDWIHFVSSVVSAIVSIIVGSIFLLAYYKEQLRPRVLWGIAFLLYASGHIINSLLVLNEISLETPLGTAATWLYVNLSGAGTTGLILYATVPLLAKRKYLSEILTLIFVILYVVGSALFAFYLPGDTPLAFFNPQEPIPIFNMSWWVVILLIPVSFVIGAIFLNHFRITGVQWAFWIGVSLVMYAIILFIWPVIELKPLFYTLRTISVLFLGIGGVQLAKE